MRRPHPRALLPIGSAVDRFFRIAIRGDDPLKRSPPRADHNPMGLLPRQAPAAPNAASSSSEPAFKFSACATPIALPNANVQTIERAATLLVLGAPSPDGLVRLDAPRDAILPRQVFAARYFTRSGAKRMLLLCLTVEGKAGMRDAVLARLVADPGGAPERESPRRPVNVAAVARVVQCMGRKEGATLNLTITDVSDGGVGFESPFELTLGDRMLLESGSQAGAELEVVRADPRGNFRYGARFVDTDAAGDVRDGLLDSADAAHAAERHRRNSAEPVHKRFKGNVGGEKEKKLVMYTRESVREQEAREERRIQRPLAD
jgi:hypothetical protein